MNRSVVIFEDGPMKGQVTEVERLYVEVAYWQQLPVASFRGQRMVIARSDGVYSIVRYRPLWYPTHECRMAHDGGLWGFSHHHLWVQA